MPLPLLPLLRLHPPLRRRSLPRPPRFPSHPQRRLPFPHLLPPVPPLLPLLQCPPLTPLPLLPLLRLHPPLRRPPLPPPLHLRPSGTPLRRSLRSLPPDPPLLLLPHLSHVCNVPRRSQHHSKTPRPQIDIMPSWVVEQWHSLLTNAASAAGVRACSSSLLFFSVLPRVGTAEFRFRAKSAPSVQKVHLRCKKCTFGAKSAPK